MTLEIFLIVYAAGFIATFIFAVGGFVAYFMGEYPTVSEYRDEIWASLPFGFFAAVIWPLGIFMVLSCTSGLKHGWHVTDQANR